MPIATTNARRIDLGINVLDVHDRDLITLTEAAKLIRGRRDEKSNVQVVQRYANPRRGRTFVIDGETVRLVLPTVGRTSGKFTTVAWVEAWKRAFAELSQRAGEITPTNPRTPRQEQRDHERAMAKLAAAGFKSAQKQAS